MPKVSATTTAKVDDFGVAIDRNDVLDGYAVSFVTINEDHSLAPMLAGLPEGRCWCPHWGYVLEGQITVTYADRVEVFEAGDAYYMTPGHVPAATKGSEFLQISPAEAMNETIAAIHAAMQEKQSPSRNVETVTGHRQIHLNGSATSPGSLGTPRSLSHVTASSSPSRGN